MADKKPMSPEEIKRRTEQLGEFGEAVYGVTTQLLHNAYDCQCFACGSTVLMNAFTRGCADISKDSAELAIREMVKALFELRREIRKHVEFEEACAAAGIDPSSAHRA